MAMVVSLLKAYLLFTIIIMVIYAIRHFIFSLNRLFTAQRLYYQDIIDSDLKSVSVLIPMHNEERVASYVLDQLLKVDYSPDKIEIIPINDHSTDGTREILDTYAR